MTCSAAPVPARAGLTPAQRAQQKNRDRAGQYRTKPAAESDLSLADDTAVSADDLYTDTGDSDGSEDSDGGSGGGAGWPSAAQAAADQHLLERRIHWDNPYEVREVYRRANQIASRSVRVCRGPLKKDIDPEAVAADAVQSLWRKQATTPPDNTDTDGDSDGGDEDGDGDGGHRWHGYLAAAIHKRVTDAAWPARPEDRAAYDRYSHSITRIGTRLGRSLSDREKDRVGYRIYFSYPNKRRPVHGFHRMPHLADMSTVRLDNPDLSPRTAAQATAAHPGSGADPDRPDMTGREWSWTEAAEIAAQHDDTDENGGDGNGDGGGTADAALLGWAVAAETDRSPIPTPASLPAARSDFAAATVDDPAAAARAWLDRDTRADTGHPDDGQTRFDALFAPFGDLDTGRRDQVAATLCDRPDLAARLWDSARRMADDRHADRIRRIQDRQTRARAAAGTSQPRRRR